MRPPWVRIIGKSHIQSSSNYGGTVILDGTHYKDLVSGLLPIATIDQAVAMANLRSISAAIAPASNAGSVTSQGDSALRALAGRTTYSVDGTGVTVGVLSDS